MIEKLSKLATYGGTWVLYLMIALSIASIAASTIRSRAARRPMPTWPEARLPASGSTIR